GFAGLDVRDGLEGFARTPFRLGADITLEGVRLAQLVRSWHFREQCYDFARAELTTVLDYRIGDTTARLKVLQFCSHGLPTIALQGIRIPTDRAADFLVSGGA